MKKICAAACAAILASTPALAVPGHGNGNGRANAYGTRNGDTTTASGIDAAYNTGGTVTCQETHVNPKFDKATCTYQFPVSPSDCATTSVPFTSDFTGQEGIYTYTFDATCTTQTGRVTY